MRPPIPTRPAEVLRPGALDGAMVASRRLPYVYVQNWKCGCSTVKHTLWAAEHAAGTAGPPGHPHLRVAGYPFVNDPARWENARDEFVFTFVRNPFTRVLSAYLDKVVHRREPTVWGRFASLHDLADKPLAFGDFLNLIARSPPQSMDVHWRPQVHTVAPGAVPYDLIGSVESLEQDLGEVLGRIFGRAMPLVAYVPHRTGSAEHLDRHYGPPELEKVRELYADDFAAFGYSLDAGGGRRRGLCPRRGSGSGPITAWGAGCRLVAGGDFAAAAVELAKAGEALAGPIYVDRLLRCRDELLAAGRDSASLPGTARLDLAFERREGSAEAWKRHGKAMLARGCQEEGLAALVLALELRPDSSRNRRRLRAARRRLALAQARQGRRADALATLGAHRRLPGLPGLAESARDLAQQAVVVCVAAVAGKAPFDGRMPRRCLR